jgi:response regulator RpfG family c-di-GMP phosphodiesterase
MSPPGPHFGENQLAPLFGQARSHSLLCSIPSSQSTVLVVDDDEMVLAALEETLTQEAFPVWTESDPRKALEILQTTNFAAVLSDQRMPGMTGLEFLAQVKRIQPEATRILLTGVLSLETLIDAINQGEIYRFLVKPWLREELLMSVRNAIQRHELIHQNAALQAQTQAINFQLQQQLQSAARRHQELAVLNESLKETLERSIRLCLQALELFLPTLGNQALRVLQLCRAMANAARLAPAETRALEIGACLHDIGFLAVPRAVIKKWQLTPENLTANERALIRRHPIIGQEMAETSQPVPEVCGLIRAHHERFDGTGYPDGLAGSEIPWLARLLCVAVEFSASRAEAPLAARQIQVLAGSAFDPEAVRYFSLALPNASMPRKAAEVPLSQLQPGMLLAQGIYTPSGKLILGEGQCLTPSQIDTVRRHQELEALTQTLVVYC